MTHSAISGGALAGETRTPCSHRPRWRRMPLDHVAVVDQGHDAHLFPALRAEERVGFPDLLDELAPLG